MKKASPRLAVLAAGVALAACGRGGGDWRQTQAPALEASSSETSGYLPAPQLTRAARASDGSVVLGGQADPNVAVRLSTPDGQAYGTTAGADGAWSANVPAAQAVREFGLSEDVAGRTVRGEGYIAVLPSQGPAAALLRAGEGAVVQTAAPAGSLLRLTAADFDATGATVVSGRTAPSGVVRLSVDGAAAGEGRGDEAGRFTINVATVLKPGAHALRASAGQASAQASLSVGAAATITGMPYRARRLAGAWRIDWLTPGGSPQSTVLFDPPES